jgi:hypothetical protein
LPHYYAKVKLSRGEERYSQDTNHSSMSNTLIVEQNEKEEGQRKEKSYNKWLIWIPSVLDFFEHLTRNISMTLLAASAN